MPEVFHSQSNLSLLFPTKKIKEGENKTETDHLNHSGCCGQMDADGMNPTCWLAVVALCSAWDRRLCKRPFLSWYSATCRSYCTRAGYTTTTTWGKAYSHECSTPVKPPLDRIGRVYMETLNSRAQSWNWRYTTNDVFNEQVTHSTCIAFLSATLPNTDLWTVKSFNKWGALHLALLWWRPRPSLSQRHAGGLALIHIQEQQIHGTSIPATIAAIVPHSQSSCMPFQPSSITCNSKLA